MHRLIEITEGNGVRRGSDRGSDTSDIGGNRDGESKSSHAFLFFRQCPEDRGQEGEHHCGGGRVAHEHGEERNHAEESEKDELWLGSERLQEHLGQLHVQSDLGGCYRKDEASQEKHDGRIGKGRKQGLVAHQGSEIGGIPRSSHEERAAVGNGEQKEHDDCHGSGPCRQDLEHPHQCGEGEDSHCSLFNDGKDWCAVLGDSEEGARNKPEEKEDCNSEKQHYQLLDRKAERRFYGFSCHYE